MILILVVVKKLYKGCTCLQISVTRQFSFCNKNKGLRPKKRNCLFPVTVRKKRVGKSLKKIFVCNILLVKNVCFMHVLRQLGEKTLW